MIRAKVIFRGKVQGVWFRANTQKIAIEHKLVGWVRNMPDGSVEALFEGRKADVEETIEWCRTRQPYAKVESAEINWLKCNGEFKEFIIKY